VTIDVSTFIGSYPFRRVPNPSVDSLIRHMDRVGVERAWVGHLPSAFENDPAPGNQELADAVRVYPDRLMAVHTVKPSLPDVLHDLDRTQSDGRSAVRVYPLQHGLAPTGPEMHAFVGVAGERRIPIILTVRFEDVRQRHPSDVAGDLPPSAVRTLIRAHPNVQLLVTHASRDFIEEVYFGSTESESARILWDICWIWGPPFDDLQTLVQTIGAERFVFGSCFPLRIMDAPVAKLDLTNLQPDQRRKIESGNLERWM